MAYLLLNDTHFGLKRITGATKASMEAFYDYQLNCVNNILSEHFDKTLIIIGDLLDSSTVPYSVVLDVHAMLSNFPGEIFLVRGNHDISKDRTKLSAFDFLCKLLPKATAVTDPYWLGEETVIIPHMDNQKLFDEAVAEASKEAFYLITHCNYENGFTKNSDHSLNLTKEQAERFEMVISGHEHNHREIGNVHMLGAPYPCNIQEAQDAKFYHIWNYKELETHAVSAGVGYTELDWSDLCGIEDSAGNFIRITGEATAEQAAQVIQDVADFRKRSSAFMITNSVRVGELELGNLDDFEENGLAGFDAMGALKEMLPKQFHAQLEKLNETD